MTLQLKNFLRYEFKSGKESYKILFDLVETEVSELYDGFTRGDISETKYETEVDHIINEVNYYKKELRSKTLIQKSLVSLKEANDLLVETVNDMVEVVNKIPDSIVERIDEEETK